MNTKTFNLYIRDESTLPLYVYGFTESTSKTARLNPTMRFIAGSPTISKNVSASFVMPISISASSISGCPTIYTASFLCTSNDCTGRDKDKTFSSVATNLSVGRDSIGKTRSWIPFVIDFSTASGTPILGAHITSASLILTAAESFSKMEVPKCKIKVGCDRTINSASPVSFSTLAKKVFGKKIYTNNDVESWTATGSYSIDVTESMKEIMGFPLGGVNGTIISGSTINWTNGSSIAMVLLDNGSGKSAYRTIVSSEGAEADLSAPILKIEYEDNYYSDNVLDTYISEAAAFQNAVFYSSPSLSIGTRYYDVTRTLIYFDLSPIDNSAVITSASMYLYLTGDKTNYARTITGYPFFNPWDFYGVSWKKRYGMGYWTSGNGGEGDYYSGSPITSASFSSAISAGYKLFNIDIPTVQSWVTMPSGNRGMILKTDDEGNKKGALVFSSSRGILARRPKLDITYTVDGSPFSETIQNTNF